MNGTRASRIAAFVAVLAQVLVGSAEEKVWVGENLGDWNTPSNWSPEGVPAKTDTAVFRPVGTLQVELSSKPEGISGFRFESGGTILHTTLPDTSGSASGSPISMPAGTNFFYAAENAVGVISNVVNGSGNAPATATAFIAKTGPGDVTVELPLGSGYGYFNSIDIREGSLTTVAGVGPTYLLIGAIRIRDGAKLVTGHAQSALFSFSPVQIDAGGIWDCGGVEQFADGLNGEGSIINAYSFKLWLKQAPYLFSGTITPAGPNNVVMTFNAKDGTTAPEDWAQYVGSENAFAACNIALNDAEGSMLRFGSGVGTFRVGQIVSTLKQRISLEDDAGEPISLYTDFCNPGTMNLRGAGTLYQTGSLRSMNSSAVDFTDFSGTIGVVPGGSMYVGNNSAASIPDVSNVADFTTVATSPADAGKNNMGWLLFQNKNCVAFDLNRISGNGIFSFLGKTVIHEADTTGAWFWLNEGADVAISRGRALLAGNQLYWAANTKLTVTNGTYVGAPETVPLYQSWTTAKRPSGISTYNTARNVGTLLVADSGVFFGCDLAAKSVTIRDGGAYWLGTGINALSGVTADDPAVLTIDGGLLQLRTEKSPYKLAVTPDDAAVRMVVGPRVARIDCDLQTAPYSESGNQFIFKQPIFASASGDAGIVRTGAGLLWSTYPLQISGPFDNRDGTLEIHPEETSVASATVPLYGTGDFRLGNARLQFRGDAAATQAITAKVGTGGLFAYDGAATVRVRNTSDLPKHNLQLGELTRGRSGAALFFWCATGGAYDDDAGSVTFAAEPETRSGRLAGPVFTLDKPEGWSYGRLGFAAYDANGIKSFDGYVAGVNGGADSVALVSTGNVVTVNASVSVGALRVDGDPAALSSVTAASMLTISSGATLTVGSASDPACVILNNRQSADYPATIKGGGRLDFGTREGIVAVNDKSGSVNFARIETEIAGSGGLTVAGPIDGKAETGLELRGANTYTGGTRVNAAYVRPTTSASLSTGDVWLGDGELCGGGLQLDTAGLVISNRIHAAGWGPWLLGETCGRGAIVFRQDATLSGDVEAVAPLRIGALPGAAGLFSGTISGASIQIWSHSVSTAAGSIAFSGSNTYAGGTEIINATLVLKDDGTVGTGPVWLGDGTLTVDSNEDRTIGNRITGVGTIRLAGRGKVAFAALDSQDGAGFTLDLARRRVTVGTLEGFSSVTSSASSTDLYVTDMAEGSYTGKVASNVRLHYGEYQKPGLMLIFR